MSKREGLALSAVLFVTLWAGCETYVSLLPKSPLWTVPGQRVKHFQSGKTGTIRVFHRGEVVVDLDDGETVQADYFKVAPLR